LSVCIGVLWPNGWTDQDAYWYGGRPRLRPYCVRRGPSPSPHGKWHSSPLLFGPCLLWPNGRPSQLEVDLPCWWTAVYLCLNVGSLHLPTVTFAKEERKGHGTCSEKEHATPLRERVDTSRTWIMLFAVTGLVVEEYLFLTSRAQFPQRVTNIA